MSQMLKSSGAMAGATLTSRVLGMVREMVYANFMGNSWEASAFVLAFQVPNLFRRLLGEGALTAAFIPIFKQKEVQAGAASLLSDLSIKPQPMKPTTAIRPLSGRFARPFGGAIVFVHPTGSSSGTDQLIRLSNKGRLRPRTSSVGPGAASGLTDPAHG